MQNLEVMVMLFTMVILGYTACKLGYMGDKFDKKLSSIVVDITCPLLVLSSVMGDEMPDRSLILPLVGVGFLTRVHCCIDNGPMEGFWGILKCEIYHYGKKYETREELEEAIREWIRYYSHERYQRRFGVKTPYEVRSEALCNENPVQYPIPENKAIQKYKATHYA